eukprot:gene6413-7440_t
MATQAYQYGQYAGAVPQQIRKEDHHSFKAPFISTSSGILFWDIYGDSIISEDYIRLTSDTKSISGSVWNTEQVIYPNWEVLVEFRIGGNSRIGADGLAFWYADRQHNFADMRDHSVFGSRNMWKGLGIFFDTFDNDGNGDNPLIAVVLNDGSQFYDTSKDGANMRLGSCTSKFRNANKNARAKIRYFNGALSIHIDASSSGSFETCVNDLRIQLPINYNFAMSAATGGLHDNHDVYVFDTYSLDPPQYQNYNYQQQQQQEVAVEEPPQQQQQNNYQQEETLQNDIQDLLKNEPVVPQYNQQQQQQQNQQQQQQQNQIPPATLGTDPLVWISQKVDSLKNSINEMHSVIDESDSKKTGHIDSLRDQVNNIGQAIVALAGSVVTKKDLDQFKASFEQKHSQSLKEVSDMKQLIQDMKATVNQRINNQDQDLSKSLESLSQNVNYLKRLSDATSKDTQKIASTLQVNANEIASTIEKQTSFGFWAYFLFVQAIFIFGFVFWRKYKDENNKKLI